jgi:hypothetical protein
MAITYVILSQAGFKARRLPGAIKRRCGRFEVAEFSGAYRANKRAGGARALACGTSLTVRYKDRDFCFWRFYEN